MAKFISRMPRIQTFNGDGDDSIKFLPSEHDIEVELNEKQTSILKADKTAKALVESGDLIDVDNVFGLNIRAKKRKFNPNIRQVTPGQPPPPSKDDEADETPPSR